MKMLTICFKGIIIVISLFLFAMDIPSSIKEIFPALWGKLEGTFERDLTCLAFVIGKGSGECRIKNSKIAFSDHGAKIYLGNLTNPLILEKSSNTYHLWGWSSDRKLIDVVCQPDEAPECKDRTFFAIYDAETLKLEYNNPANYKDRYQVDWANSYLPALKAALRK